MREIRPHPYVRELKRQLVARRIDRREFLRTATLLGLSAGAAYRFAGLPAPARAETSLPKGGTLRIGMRCHELTDPHTYSWIEASNSARQVLDYLTVTGVDNVTRPSLCARWEASDDLKTWTLHLRQDVRWHDGRAFVADDVVWNLKRLLDPAIGSSTVGLMESFLLESFETGEKDDEGKPKTSMRLWRADAIEKLDDHTVRLNGRSPQIAVPENLYHYNVMMMDPKEGGTFKVGSNGTGAFVLVENEVGRRQAFRADPDHWGGAPHVDRLEFIDLGDDPAAALGALAARQVDGIYLGAPTQLAAMKRLAHIRRYQVSSAYTAVARMQPTQPFDDKRVRQAIRRALDCMAVLEISNAGLGEPGEHHHVSPIHPEYAKLPAQPRDVALAKQLLAEAGHPDGIDIEIAARASDSAAWELVAVQAMVEQWREAGIRVKINVMPSTEYWDVWTKVPFGFTTWAHRPLGIMTYSLAYRSGAAWNESHYANPEFDRLLTIAEGQLDVDARRGTMAKLEAIMLDDGPIAQPVWRALFTFMDKRVKGFRMHPSGYLDCKDYAVDA